VLAVVEAALSPLLTCDSTPLAGDIAVAAAAAVLAAQDAAGA